ncbi:DUF732 domain-containing protein [Nocardioides rubriscoriae]|uniref:DUF732 domain-containing protein n=1 Tax=Nocardioides rubriscoriae TaxID=642762 RepID=UPI0011DFE12F|nr:DUF732 domain-containing protein [Nocardioides rubriscoriae]
MSDTKFNSVSPRRWWIYLDLTEPRSVPELAARAALADSTVKAHVRALVSLGVVQSVEIDGEHRYERAVVLTDRQTALARQKIRAVGLEAADDTAVATAPRIVIKSLANSAEEDSPVGFSVRRIGSTRGRIVAVAFAAMCVALILAATRGGSQTRESATSSPALSPPSPSVIEPTLEGVRPSKRPRSEATATAGPSLPTPTNPPEPIRDPNDDLPRSGPISASGRTFTQAQARDFATRLRGFLVANNFSYSSDSQLLDIGASICDGLDAGSDEREAFELAGYDPFEANLYVSMAEGVLCPEHFPFVDGDF